MKFHGGTRKIKSVLGKQSTAVKTYKEQSEALLFDEKSFVEKTIRRKNHQSEK